ncbi:MAG: hypothetical protein OXH00_22975 [Candidatus Poribacteria bacterium]|nr:hypothetical protein [Candidatus Poribacteria bacterium]
MLNFRTLLSCLLVLAIFVYGLPVYSQSSESVEPTQTQAAIDAETDTAANVNRLMWIGGTFVGTSLVGCLFCGLPAIITASIHEPSLPAHRLMGKSAEYVTAYQTAYKEAVKAHQTRNATLGCLGGSVVAAIVWGIYYSNQQ